MPSKTRNTPTAHHVSAALALLEEGHDMAGVCVNCGEEADRVEPDATTNPCDSCGKSAVWGAEEIILAGVW